jgi:hypothetical protein
LVGEKGFVTHEVFSLGGGNKNGLRRRMLPVPIKRAVRARERVRGGIWGVVVVGVGLGAARFSDDMFGG